MLNQRYAPEEKSFTLTILQKWHNNKTSNAHQIVKPLDGILIDAFNFCIWDLRSYQSQASHDVGYLYNWCTSEIKQ